VVLDISYQRTDACLVLDGYCFPHACTRQDIGGCDLENYFVRTLDESKINVPSNADAAGIMHKNCRMALDYQ
jgi:actin-related protein